MMTKNGYKVIRRGKIFFFDSSRIKELYIRYRIDGVFKLLENEWKKRKNKDGIRHYLK